MTSMTSAPTSFPTPADALDAGTLADLASAGAAVDARLDVPAAQPWGHAPVQVEVPSDAASLGDAFEGYCC